MKRQEQGHQDSQAISKEELPKEVYQSILQDIRAREAFIYARRSLKDTAKPEEQMETRGADRATMDIEKEHAKKSNIHIHMPKQAYRGSRWNKRSQEEMDREEQMDQEDQEEPYKYICQIYMPKKRMPTETDQKSIEKERRTQPSEQQRSKQSYQSHRGSRQSYQEPIGSRTAIVEPYHSKRNAACNIAIYAADNRYREHTHILEQEEPYRRSVRAEEPYRRQYFIYI